MSERFRRLGVSEKWLPHAAHYAGVMQGLGMTRSQIDEAIRWGAAYSGPIEDVRQHFDALCTRHHIDTQLADFSESWHGQVLERGIENMPDVSDPAPARADDERRLAEIREGIRNDPDSYESNVDLRDEHLAIIERLGVGEEKPPTEQTSATPTPNSNRLAQIRELRRSDPDAYDGNPALQREELALLSARSAGDAPTPFQNSQTTETINE